MYPDEGRTPDELDRLRAWAKSMDLDSLAEELRDARISQRQASSLQQALAELVGVANPSKADLEEHRLGIQRARAALEAYRLETQRLKRDLARVRKSRSMRLGRAILGPPRWLLRKVASRVAGPAPALERPIAAKDAEGKLEESSVEASSRGESATDLRAATELLAVLKRLWDDQGLISQTAALIQQHRTVVEQFTEVDRVFVARVEGHHRVQLNGVDLAAEGQAPLYVPARDRIMYCVHSTPVYNSNGYAVRTRGIANALQKVGQDVVVVGRMGYPWDSKVDSAKPRMERSSSCLDGIEYVHLQGPSLYKLPLDNYLNLAADAIVQEALRFRPSVIQAASNFHTGLPALIAARRLGIPFVYEVRGLWEITEASARPGWDATERFRQQRALETLVANGADSVLAITQEVADELVSRGVSRTRISILPNGFDPETAVPLPKDEKYAEAHGISLRMPVIGFAGSLVEYEGLDLLLDASRILQGRGVAHQVVIAGSGPHEKALQRRADMNGLANVLFLGRRPHEEMPQLLSCFDILACPRQSKPVTEMVSPLKPLDGFAAGRAVVLSDLSPHRALAGDRGERARLFNPGEAAELAGALENLCSDSDGRANLARRARLWAVKERSWEELVRRTLKVYRHRSTGRGEPRAVGSLNVATLVPARISRLLEGAANLTPLQADGPKIADTFDFALFASDAVAKEVEASDALRAMRHCQDHALSNVSIASGWMAELQKGGVPVVFWDRCEGDCSRECKQLSRRADHILFADPDKMTEYVLAAQEGGLSLGSLTTVFSPSITRPELSQPECAPSIHLDGSVEHLPRDQREFYRSVRNILDRLPVSLVASGSGSKEGCPECFAMNTSANRRPNLAVLHIPTDSTSRFLPQEVVEVAGRGELLISADSAAVRENLAGVVASGDSADELAPLLQAWCHDPWARWADRWRQMRWLYRARRADSAIVAIARMVGLQTYGEVIPKYSLFVAAEDVAALSLKALAQQSVLPENLFYEGVISPAVEEEAADLGVRIRSIERLDGQYQGWIGRYRGDELRTHFEDLLIATQFATTVRRVDYEEVSENGNFWHAESIAHLAVRIGSQSGLVWASGSRTWKEDLDRRQKAVLVSMPDKELRRPVMQQPIGSARPERRVLVAGHDFKFSGSITALMESAGVPMSYDRWQSHWGHDALQSEALLAEADTVWCEWGLGNAVWYSNNVSPTQKLVVRVHSQELRTPYLRRINHERVDKFVFVSEMVRAAAIVSHGIPAEKTLVIPNMVDSDGLDRPKEPGSEWTLGMVGYGLMSKRLDLALLVFEQLLQVDRRYRLRLKGKSPDELPWVWGDDTQRLFFERQMRTIDRINAQNPGGVSLDPHGDDMVEWYRKVGYGISVSDHESFHMTIPDSAASGAVPVCLAWSGADYIYPLRWLVADPCSMMKRIRQAKPDLRDKSWVRRSFGPDVVFPRWEQLLLRVTR